MQDLVTKLRREIERCNDLVKKNEIDPFYELASALINHMVSLTENAICDGNVKWMRQCLISLRRCKISLQSHCIKGGLENDI